MRAGERGHLFENMVVMEMVKQVALQKKRVECSFYRTSSGVEIDLIVDSEGALDLYEIKYAKP